MPMGAFCLAEGGLIMTDYAYYRLRKYTIHLALQEVLKIMTKKEYHNCFNLTYSNLTPMVELFVYRKNVHIP